MAARRRPGLVDQRKERQEGLDKRQLTRVVLLPARHRCRQGLSPKQRQRKGSNRKRQPNEEGLSAPGNQTIGLPVIGLTILGPQMRGRPAQRLTLHGWWQPHGVLPTIQHMLFWTLAAHGGLDQERQSKDSRSTHGIMALRQNSAVATNLSCLPNPRQKPARKVASSTFQQFHHVLPMLMCLRQVMCPSCFPSLRRKTSMTVKLDRKGDKITCPAFALCSSPAGHPTMGHIVLDLTNLAYQPTTRRDYVTFAMSERRPAYPAYAPDMDEDKGATCATSIKEGTVEERDQAVDDEDLAPLVLQDRRQLHQCEKSKDPQVWQDPAATLQPKDSRERAEDASLVLGRMSEGGALRNIISKLSEERNMKNLHLKHYQMSTAQFKKRLDIPGKNCDLYQHVVKK